MRRLNFTRLSVLAWSLFLALAGTSAQPIITRPYEGVTLIERLEESPRHVIMHIAIVDLTTPGVRFKLTPPGGPRETVRQTTLDFLNEQRAQLAINCHFMQPYPSLETNVNVAGLAVMNGHLYSPFEPQPITPEFPDQSYAILPYAPAFNIGRNHRASVVHCDPAQSDNVHTVENARLWIAVSGSAQIVSNGVITIPDYTDAPGGLSSLNGYSAENSWYGRLRARTAIGAAAAGKTVVLFTVDETDGSGGMSVGEVADVLIRDYGVQEAINLDGGGSTTMARQDPRTRAGRLVNTPSDNPLGRAVGSSLGVFARPRHVPPLKVANAQGRWIIVSWPAGSPGWRLQQNTDLHTGLWTDLKTVPHELGGRWQTVLVSSPTPTFFRLHE